MTKGSRRASALLAGRMGRAMRRVVVPAGLAAALLVVAASAARAQLGADRPTARQGHVTVAGNVDDIEILILPCSGA